MHPPTHATQQTCTPHTQQTTQDQVAVWESIWWVRFFRHAPQWLLSAVNWVISCVLMNRFVLWYGGGVPCKQYELIMKDGMTMPEYCGRTIAGVAYNSHLRTDNYFYYNCLTGVCVCVCLEGVELVGCCFLTMC